MVLNFELSYFCQHLVPLRVLMRTCGLQKSRQIRSIFHFTKNTEPISSSLLDISSNIFAVDNAACLFNPTSTQGGKSIRFQECNQLSRHQIAIHVPSYSITAN
uniref:Uncharacterized protein n=1 Tax=Arundo donax TaxID=35708 RepID=A0A0A9CNS4_ARUDO